MNSENRIDMLRPDAPELAARGRFAVGVQTTRANVAAPDAPPRMLTLELWYPAVQGTKSGTRYDTLLRDGVTAVSYHGSACRDAAVADISAPLVVLSHGFPGNRYLMSHLAESLAAKGFVVAAPDHAGSTYEDHQDFGETLLHRPLDQRGVIDAVAGMSGDVARIADTSRVGVIGFSMGGYGALVLGGAGLSAAALVHVRAPADGSLARHRAGSASHTALQDPRIKALIPIGPWGRGGGFWDAAGMAGLKVPTLLMAGTADEVSVYAAMRQIFTEATGAERHLLSFEHAGHNAAAPVPAPAESWAFSEELGWAPFGHYADAVWDTVRMNNIAQHSAAAFLGLHLRGDSSLRRYLDGNTWPGFPAETARGLRFETYAKGASL
ncbi:Predicted dienelactone hydrolase [Sulfitobacter brevis]|uniref:Predicted dienelactone hydrolase n=1 Tax=Sulfitobacter brevis TaxID=74348 RepID=A0A1I2AVC4_9RHOB|nr:alpha/beta fold hydrolase [Sulfitobacter brevis]SFE47786.1 Predicted dienelactone hydrolase [Sulfitobacter brevis]